MKHYNPFLQLLRLAKVNSSHEPVNSKDMLPWIGKFLITEPFRQYERITTDRKVTETTLQKDPIFVLGHWRSGTSFLQYLLGQDPQFGYLSKFQAIFPELFLTAEHLFKPLVKKISKSLSTRDQVKDISVNWNWDSPSELDIAITAIGSPASPHWGHTFPNNHTYYFRKYLFLQEASQKDRQQWKEVYDYLIKKLAVHYNNKQILIKSPGNTARVRYLLEMYPNAKFVYIHRNPYEVYYSNIKLWNVLLDNLSFQDFDRSQLESIILDNYTNLLQSYLTDRDLIPEGNLTELRLEDLTEQPIDELSKIYDNLGLDGFYKMRPKVEAFLSQQTKGSGSNYDITDEMKKTIDKHWKFSFNEWPYHTDTNKKANAATDNKIKQAVSA